MVCTLILHILVLSSCPGHIVWSSWSTNQNRGVSFFMEFFRFSLQHSFHRFLHSYIVSFNLNFILSSPLMVRQILINCQSTRVTPKVIYNLFTIAALAQMVACLPLVQQFRGSIPGGVANFHLKIFNLGARRGGVVHFLIARSRVR